MTFRTALAKRIREIGGKLHGDRILLGMTGPVALEVTFNTSGVSPATKLDAAAFLARGSTKRTDLGMGAERLQMPARSSTWTRSRR